VNLAVAIVTLLGKRVDGRSIRKIKIGGIELENPTREDLEVLRNRIAATQARE
jgi:hypothetical protein